MPLVQLQPLRRDLLYEEVMLDFSIGSLGPAEWESYYETVAKPKTQGRIVPLVLMLRMKDACAAELEMPCETTRAESHHSGS